eukprot:3952748-Heterocapsa_arctica.AAC.1
MEETANDEAERQEFGKLYHLQSEQRDTEDRLIEEAELHLFKLQQDCNQEANGFRQVERQFIKEANAL